MSATTTMTLADFVARHTVRGECQCGQCIDRGDRPDPEGHTADLVFFKVALANAPDPERFRELTKAHRGEFGDCNPLDGREHSYMELGGWIGDQGLAMQYMGLGVLLGVFSLLTPYTLLGLPQGDPLAMQAAGGGLVCVLAKAST